MNTSQLKKWVTNSCVKNLDIFNKCRKNKTIDKLISLIK